MSLFNLVVKFGVLEKMTPSDWLILMFCSFFAGVIVGCLTVMSFVPKEHIRGR